jgi:hypothetical protein
MKTREEFIKELQDDLVKAEQNLRDFLITVDYNFEWKGLGNMAWCMTAGQVDNINRIKTLIVILEKGA